jgi:ATP-dependent Clp protease ATP-binding subunit ClpC
MDDGEKGVYLALLLAEREAKAGGAATLEPGHVLMGLTRLTSLDQELLRAFPSAQQTELTDVGRFIHERFAKAGLDPQILRRALRRAHKVPGTLPRTARSPLDPLVHAAMRRGWQEADGQEIGVDELLYQIVADLPARCRSVFSELGVKDPVAVLYPNGGPVRLKGRPHRGPAKAATRAADPPVEPEPKPEREPKPDPKPAPPPVPTPYLDKYGRDLTRAARDGRLPTVIGRRTELKMLARVLVRQRKPNAVLVGPAGVGKTGIVEALASHLTTVGTPPDLAGSRILEISMSALLAGAEYRGDFERLLRGVLKEAQAAPEVILFIDELHTVLRAGGRGASDAANILKPALARGEVRCIGATTAGTSSRTPRCSGGSRSSGSRSPRATRP